MATMHTLFLGLFSFLILYIGGLGHVAVSQRKLPGHVFVLAQNDFRVSDRPLNRQASRNLRERIVDIAVQEIGVREATGSNDGLRVEAYLRYVDLGKGYAWCAAFASWCYGKAGLAAPRNAWSPALFPLARRYTARQINQGTVRQADLFAIYNQNLGRIDHVGIVRKKEGNWIVTVEGNSANRVLSKRRLLATIYAFSNWLD